MAKGIKIPVTLDTKGLQKQLGAMQNSASSSINKINNSLKSLTETQTRARKEWVQTDANSPLSPTKSAAIAGGVAGIAASITSSLLPALKDLTAFAIRAATAQEDLTLKFKPLLGSIENARARMSELNKFASATPFQLPDVANASRVLQALTEGALATGQGLRLVGDAAASSGEDFQSLAVHVGRAYSGLQANRPVGESVSRLQELGLVTGNTRNEIEKLQKAGKGKEAWVVLQAELKKTQGAMKDLSGTTTGIFSTLKDNVEQAFAQGMTPALETFKVAMSSAIELIQRWIKSGNLIDVGEFLGNIASIAIYVGSTFYNMATFVSRTIKNFLVDPIFTWVEAMTDASIVAGKLLTLDFSGAWSTAKTAAVTLKDNIVETFTDTGDAFTNWVGDSARANDDLVDSMTNVAVTAERMRRELETPLKETAVKKAVSPTADKPKVKAQTEAELNRINQMRNEILVAQGETELERLRIQSELEVEAVNSKFDRMLEEQEKYNVTSEQVEKARAASLGKIAQRETDFLKIQSDKRARMELKRANERIQIAEHVSAATFDVLRAFGAKNKGLAIAEATINTALAVTKTFANYGFTPIGIAAAAAQTASGAAQISAISQQNFQDGGFPEGRNAQITVNENGQESVMNANATQRLGRRNIDALNNGARPDQLFGNGGGGNSQNIEVYYSPVQTFNGGDSGDIISALENEREAFAEYVNDSIKKGVLSV